MNDGYNEAIKSKRVSFGRGALGNTFNLKYNNPEQAEYTRRSASFELTLDELNKVVSVSGYMGQ